MKSRFLIDDMKNIQAVIFDFDGTLVEMELKDI